MPWVSQKARAPFAKGTVLNNSRVSWLLRNTCNLPIKSLLVASKFSNVFHDLLMGCLGDVLRMFEECVGDA